jgi:hypothetical protein
MALIRVVPGVKGAVLKGQEFRMEAARLDFSSMYPVVPIRRSQLPRQCGMRNDGDGHPRDWAAVKSRIITPDRP